MDTIEGIWEQKTNSFEAKLVVVVVAGVVAAKEVFLCWEGRICCLSKSFKKEPQHRKEVVVGEKGGDSELGCESANLWWGVRDNCILYDGPFCRGVGS